MPTKATPSTVVSIRLNAQDAAILTRAAKAENATLSQYIKNAAWDRVEDTLDIIKIKRAVAHAKRHPETVRPWAEFEKEYFGKK